jgi:hypothetical protein
MYQLSMNMQLSKVRAVVRKIKNKIMIVVSRIKRISRRIMVSRK